MFPPRVILWVHALLGRTAFLSPISNLIVLLHFRRIFLDVFWRKIRRIFLDVFWRKSGGFLFGKLRRSCPGPLRKLRPELSHIISAGHTHLPLPGPRPKTDLLTLEHGIATGPVNCATFQSAGPRAGISKLEDCTVFVGASLD